MLGDLIEILFGCKNKGKPNFKCWRWSNNYSINVTKKKGLVKMSFQFYNTFCFFKTFRDYQVGFSQQVQLHNMLVLKMWQTMFIILCATMNFEDIFCLTFLIKYVQLPLSCPQIPSHFWPGEPFIPYSSNFEQCMFLQMLHVFDPLLITWWCHLILQHKHMCHLQFMARLC